MLTVTTRELSEILGVSKKSVLQKAKSEHWQYKIKSNTKNWLVESLSSEVQILIEQENKLENKKTSSTTFVEATELERSKAKLRAAIINAYQMSALQVQDFCPAFNSGFVNTALQDEYKKELTVRTFYRWLKDYKETGVSGLTPIYSKGNKKCGAGSTLKEEEKEILKFFYLHYNKRSIRHCYLTMKQNIPESEATYTTCFRYLKSLPLPIVTFYREGMEALNAKCFPYIERNKKLLKSLDQVQGDHHIFDRLIRYKGELVRPWITSFADVASGSIVGWCVSTNPSSQTILAAFHMMISHFGLPKMVHVDNGKDYKGKTIKGNKAKIKVLNDDGIEREEEIIITGAIVTCGCRLQYAQPYHGQSKAVQERFYKILEEYYSKNTNNYLGSDTTARVDEQKSYWRSIKGFAKREDVTEWEDFVNEMAHWVHWFNTQWVSQAKGRKGLTPQQAFMQNMPENIRKADPATVELALTKGEVRKVFENGIRIAGISYWAKELGMFIGQEIIARVNLVNRNEMLVCNNKGKVICKAYANEFMETGDLSLDNEKINSARKDIRKQVIQASKYEHLKRKPKNMLEIAMEATGIELPQIENFVPQIEEKKVLEMSSNNKKNKYKNYFETDDISLISEEKKEAVI